MIDEALFRALVTAAAGTISAHAEELTALDSAIGDGDHGHNMRRGVEAVLSDLESIAVKPLPEALKAIGTKLVMTVGGASGPLYGTLFLTLGKELANAPPASADLAGAMAKAVDAVAARGKSELGQKTMLDVLYPVADALNANRSGAEIAAIAAAAAEATRNVKAIRGRASFLGERSVGHVDPGARSSALIVEAVAGALQ
ncbi:MAG: dihydroxyacetone kinase subunit DhaL [Devosia sp.]|nr:dihydroxyacetone kinase subunit DhaL [Devosia sp.]